MAKGTLDAGACLVKIRRASGNKNLSQKDAQDLMDGVEAHIRSVKNRWTPSKWTPDDLQEAVLKYITKKTNEKKLAGLIKKRAELVNIAAERNITNYVDRFDNNPTAGIDAYGTGTVRSFQGARLSTDSKGKALSQQFQGWLLNDLEKAGVYAEFVRGKLGKEMFIELYEMKPGGVPGKSGSEAARKMAEVVTKYQNKGIDLANRAGAFIIKKPGHVGRVGHDQTKIRRATFEQWHDDILPLLDGDKTFADVDNPRQMLKDIYRSLLSGNHYKLDDVSQEGALGFTGSANVAKRLSKVDSLHFKDGESFYNYNEKYGSAQAHELVVFGMDHLARSAVLLQDWGTNPKAMMRKIVEKYTNKFIDEPKITDALKSDRLENIMAELDGTTRIPKHLTAARVFSGVRLLQTVSKLGMATLSSVTDIPIQVHSALREIGVNPFTGYLNGFTSMVRGRSSGETQAISRSLGAGFDGIIGDIVSRISSSDGIHQVMSRTQRQFFKLNLMSWWNDSQKTGLVTLVSTHLAGSADKPLSKVGKELQETFKIFDVNEREWNIIRSTAWDAGNGSKYITTDKIEALPDEVFRTKLFQDGINEPSANQIADARFDLTLKVQTMFQDLSDTGIPVPGASEHATLNQGTRPGSILGESLRLMAQFKSFPLTLLHKVVGRAVLRGVEDPNLNPIKALITGKSDIMGLSQLMVGLFTFGYMSMTMKEAVKGRTPPPLNVRNIQRAMAQGGGLGIYGDVIFGEFSQFGSSLLSQLVGPSVGQFDSVGELFTRFKQNEKPAKSAVRLLTNNMPGSNLFYTKWVLDYLFLSNLNELMNPGYLNRLEQRTQERGQRHFIPPN